MLQMECYLDCAITYLYQQCRPSERTFESLEKLARVTARHGEAPSPFEIILSDARRDIPDTVRNRFQSVYTPEMQGRLVSALQVIMAYIQEKHGQCQVRFEIKHGDPMQ